MKSRQEVSVLKTYSTALSYLKQHYKLYYSLYGIYMILFLIPTWLRYFIKDINPTVQSRYNIIFLIISLINIRIFMALVVAIRETIAEHDIDIKRALSKTTTNLWPYFRSFILLEIISFIPILLWVSNSSSGSTFMRIGVTIIGIFIAITLHTYYGFAPEIAVIFNEKKKLLYKSHGLMNGYFDKVFLLNLPSFILLFISLGIDKYAGNVFISEGFRVLNLLILPFFEIATVIMILKLFKIKNTVNNNSKTE